jgi:hypothetical protein
VRASASKSKKATRRSLTPSSITSCTGGVAEPTMQQPLAMALSSDQERAKGQLR